MFSLALRHAPDEADSLDAALWEAGAEGVIEEPGIRRAFFSGNAADASALALRFSSFQPEVRFEPEVDWEARTRASFPPLEIGRRFFLVPPWNSDPTPPGRLRLVVEPGMGCGTGWHPCTQLCLQAMEDCVRPGSSFADIGCGSGILSSAAALLGATRIAACDIDPEAARLARDAFGFLTFTGSADALRSAFADTVAANISSAAAVELAPELHRLRVPSGALILSGFPAVDEPRLPFPVLRRLSKDGWSCLVA